MRSLFFSRRVIERVAENRILEAARQGAFDHLPGQGRPLAGLDEPYDPRWWIRNWIAREAAERLQPSLSARDAGRARALIVSDVRSWLPRR